MCLKVTQPYCWLDIYIMEHMGAGGFKYKEAYMYVCTIYSNRFFFVKNVNKWKFESEVKNCPLRWVIRKHYAPEVHTASKVEKLVQKIQILLFLVLVFTTIMYFLEFFAQGASYTYLSGPENIKKSRQKTAWSQKFFFTKLHFWQF